MTPLKLRLVVVVAASALALACSASPGKHGGAARGQPAPAMAMQITMVPEAALVGMVIPPHGRWRLAPRRELEHVVLWLSHVLVRHAQAEPRDAPFSPPGWSVQPPPPSRTREQAFELAKSIAAQARKAPQDFAQLAQRYSEDTLTRELGGSLGGLPASQLVSHETILDALAELRPGDVSGVLETSYGFHVFLRRPPPDAEELSGRHIVIGHDQAPWLLDRRAGRNVQRTRAQAQTLALSLVQQLRAQPDAFGSFVDRYSEHSDAEAGGDFGQWGSREPSAYRRQVDQLSRLQIGEISDPLETARGFEIFQRTALEPRTRYTISLIRLSFDPEAPATRPDSLAAMRSRAESALAFIRHQAPARFAEFQAKYCCSEHESWSAGRGDRALSAALDAVPVDTVLDRVFVIENNVVIAKKLAPEPPPATELELPAPNTPDLEYLARNVPAARLSVYVGDLARRLVTDLQLEGDERAAFELAHAKLVSAFAQAVPADRVGILEHALIGMHELLGDASFERYMAAVHADVTKVMLQ